MAGLLDFAQAASNATAQNVSGGVDLIALALRKLGLPIPDAPVMSTDWLKQKGIIRDVPQSAAQVAGETVGLLSPMMFTKAPEIAKGLLQIGDNIRTMPPSPPPGSAGAQMGMIRLPHGMVPENASDVEKLTTRFDKLINQQGVSTFVDKSNISPSRYISFTKPNSDDGLTLRISNHRDVHRGGDFSIDPQTGGSVEQAIAWLRDSGIPVADKVKPVGNTMANRVNKLTNSLLGGGGGDSLYSVIGKKTGTSALDPANRDLVKKIEQEVYGIYNKPSSQYTVEDWRRLLAIQAGDI